ncbi:MAG: VWA domain-containing protein [Treponemataceae bacterium]|nr:VWA domain-containing protein [Treponemataceae bacterium]
MIRCAHPGAFLLLVPLIPALVFLFARTKRLFASLGSLHGGTAVRRDRRALATKIMLRAVAWVGVVFACAGISWGKKIVPVQKSGDAVCFVFDISYSMNARDAVGGMTRLEAARQYAKALLGAMPAPSVSVVIAKGDGVLAVPLTEDLASVHTLLDVLSPELMTATGSRLGRGIAAAVTAFPPQSAQAAHVWVFTDGDETDGGLRSAVDDAVRYGIPVALIGFGSEPGADVTAGDGTTVVHTVLQAQKLRSCADRANEASAFPRRSRGALAQYIPAAESGSAYRLLRTLSADGADGTAFAYESQDIDRRAFFLLFALICFVASFVVGEAGLSARSLRQSAVLVACGLVPFVSSCNARGNAAVARGAWAWYQQKYPQATAIFLQVESDARAAQDDVLVQYAVFGLAATYLAQEEFAAADARLKHIAPDAPASLRSAAFYNEGVIAHQQGDNERAVECFKQAILADPANRDAKINLELCQSEAAMRQAQGAEKEMRQAGEGEDDSALEKGIFTLIKENEQNQWKKMQSNKKDDGGIDF